MWPFGKKKEKVVELSATQQRVQEFARQFESEELDLVAVTGPEGLKAEPDGENDLLSVSVSLTAWMDEFDSVVHREPVTLVTLADGRLRDYLRARIYPDFIIKVKARPGKDGKSFQLIGLPEPGFDPELKAILDSQVAPVTVTAPGVGELTLNRRIGCLQAEVAWGEGRIQLTLEADEEERDARLAAAARLLEVSARWDAAARSLAAGSLLEQVNAQLEEAGEETVEEAAFAAALEPESVQLSGEDVKLWFGCELLYGQSVCVSGDEAQPERAEIE
jgi:hypothetical protein